MDIEKNIIRWYKHHLVVALFVPLLVLGYAISGLEVLLSCLVSVTIVLVAVRASEFNRMYSGYGVAVRLNDELQKLGLPPIRVWEVWFGCVPKHLAARWWGNLITIALQAIVAFWPEFTRFADGIFIEMWRLVIYGQLTAFSGLVYLWFAVDRYRHLRCSLLSLSNQLRENKGMTGAAPFEKLFELRERKLLW